MSLRPHHRVWLAAHPSRSAAWLKARTSDGFHIHHVDGDHGNNNADNLVLVEGTGHAQLHGLMPRRPRARERKLWTVPVVREGVVRKFRDILEGSWWVVE